jgi:hypothetical protein
VREREREAQKEDIRVQGIEIANRGEASLRERAAVNRMYKLFGLQMRERRD